MDGVEREAVRRVEEVLIRVSRTRSCCCCPVSSEGRRRGACAGSGDRRVLAERQRPAAALDPDGGRVAARVGELPRQRGPDADDDLKERREIALGEEEGG